MNQSQIDNTGVLRTDAIACPNCRSNEFYRDAQSGMVCIHCGLEMHNFLLESQEEAGQGGDGADITFGARHLLRTAQKLKILRSTFRAPLVELLSIYQYCLIVMSKEIAQLLSPDEIRGVQLQELLLDTTRSLWETYLSQWQKSSSPCRMEGIFCKQFFNKTDDRFCVCSDPTQNLQHPVFPTKPLLLGFISLAIRILRLSCIPADLVRFCDRGLLTYHNLWDALPLEVRQPIEHSHYTRFFTLKHHGRLTPINIWYHTTSLAHSLDIVLPSLNAPAIALSFIHSLGFPEDEVWPTYVQLAHLHETNIAPLVGLESMDVHYPEEIMVVVLLSCMMCNTWTEWSLSAYTALSEMKDHPSTITALPNPVDFVDLDQELPRKWLPVFLKQSRLVLSDIQRKHFQAGQTSTANSGAIPPTLRPLNRVILHLLREKLEISDDGKLQGDLFPQGFAQLIAPESDDEVGNDEHAYADSMPIEKVVFCNRLMYYHWLSVEDKTFLRMLDGRPSRTIQQPSGQKSSPPLRHFTSHARHAEDVSGRRSVAFNLLVERAAKYLFVPPLLLQHGLDALDRQISSLIFDEQGNLMLQAETETQEVDGRNIDVSFVYHDKHLSQRVASMAQWKTADRRLRRKFHQQLREQQEAAAIEADAEVKMYARYREKTANWLPMLHEMYLSGEINQLLSDDEDEESAAAKMAGNIGNTRKINNRDSESEDEETEDSEPSSTDSDSRSEENDD